MTESWEGRHVLVTGGTGFIGSFLVEYLLDHGARVRVPIRAEHYRALSSRRGEVEWLDGDLRDPDYCADLLDGIDEVFHFASSRRTSEYHEKRPSDVLNDNIRMTLALLDGLKEKELKIPVTFCSSANVPPTLDVIALADAHTVDGYILAKAICESLWLTAARQRHFPLLIVRPVGVYGPRDTFNEDANLVPALMVQARDAEDTLVVWGDGSQERAFLYVTDFVSAIFTLLGKGVEGIQYITTNHIVSVRTLSEEIRDLIRPGLPITFEPAKTVGDRAIPVLAVHPVLESFAWTSLHDGLASTYRTWNAV
jgi:nucleoside-diphosphate-sugar epimerase